MKALADWLHARGLKLGLYSDRGTHDFSGAGLGMKGHEVDDANYLASVGADYLKVDDMSGTPKTAAGAAADYAKIRDALNATGRPIFFSTCGHSPPGGGIGNKMPWVGPACADLANACRIASDVRQWGNGTFGTAKAINLMAAYGGNYSVAGAWPDPDLLFSYPAVGGDNELKCKGAGVLAYCTGSFCDPEPENSRAQYALWSILGAPLLLSFDVRLLHTDSQMKATYANPEIIAINQDSTTDGAVSMTCCSAALSAGAMPCSDRFSHGLLCYGTRAWLPWWSPRLRHRPARGKHGRWYVDLGTEPQRPDAEGCHCAAVPQRQHDGLRLEDGQELRRCAGSPRPKPLRAEPRPAHFSTI
jgi:alpha-galactosidase